MWWTTLRGAKNSLRTVLTTIDAGYSDSAMKTFRGIIDAFGVGAVCDILGLTDSHVRVMKTRDSIPPEYWESLIDAAPHYKVRGLTYKVLFGMRYSRFYERAS
jgi:hypothetical protein